MVVSRLADQFVYYALNHPKMIARTMAIATLALIAMAALPNFMAEPFLPKINVDTDPENMLAANEPVRVTHHDNKKAFSLSDMVVVGVVNDSHPAGVFNVDSLDKIYRLTEFARGLSWADEKHPGRTQGVVAEDMIAPSTVDNIQQGGLGEVKFSWLMAAPPKTDEEALEIRQLARNIPFLNGTLVSEDGRAIALYLPITSKDVSFRIRKELLAFTADWQGDEEIYITGLPVAEDTFGVEMFVQMAISAPLAMVVIFLLLWWFFKRMVLVVSPMIVAMVSAIATMALLIISGNTIHIMSSMIPIFVMPIAVLDAVHILSEFFDRYPLHKDKRETIKEVMHTLFAPMLLTTLTTMAGFLSLALTPIPPVQVFGVFVAIGVFIAWLLTILFIPAYLMMISEKRLDGYGHSVEGEDQSVMGRWLPAMGRIATTKPKAVILATVAIGALSAFGISRIVINDNPIHWFGEKHSIRIADRVLNEHFGGTYMAYISLAPEEGGSSFDRAAMAASLADKRRQAVEEGAPTMAVDLLIEQLELEGASLEGLTAWVEESMSSAAGDEYFAWSDLLLVLDEARGAMEVFKQPAILEWMAQLQGHLLAQGNVGKINSLVDVVKTVHRELLLGEAREFRIPSSANAVGQTLMTYQNSHRPQDLWHFVTPDYRHANLWLQLTSGDNQDMAAVTASLDEFIAASPPPAGIRAEWFGLTYINLIWQEKMVTGMLTSFLGSFIVVLAMMVVLFRSFIYGILAMIPLTVTVGLIYGVIGLIGKDYDMPVAVLSALSLGLAVDYAIHFLARSREAVARAGSWSKAVPTVFGEPARAISRNAVVLSAGFLPLLAAPLVPYQTVGIFIATIILSAGLATLVILPALMTIFRKRLFKEG